MAHFVELDQEVIDVFVDNSIVRQNLFSTIIELAWQSNHLRQVHLLDGHCQQMSCLEDE